MAGEINFYTVKPNDNLIKIAKANGVSYENILLWNPDIKNPNTIHPGQRINLSAPVSTETPAAPAKSSKETLTASVFQNMPAQTEPLVHISTPKPAKAATPASNDTPQGTHLLADYLSTEQSEELRNLRPEVKRHEGEKPAMYFAPEGKSTIGYGHLLRNKPDFLTEIETKKEYTSEQLKKLDKICSDSTMTKEEKLAAYNKIKQEKKIISRQEKQRLFNEAMKDPVKKAAYQECLKQNLRTAAENTDIKTGDGGVSLDIADNCKLTQDQMELLLASDMKDAEQSVETYLGETWGNLTTGQKQVVMDIQFNTGKFTINSKYPNFKKHLRAGEYDKAQGELDLIRDSVNKKVQLGLIARNYHRMELMNEEGNISEEGKATILKSVNAYLTEHGRATAATYEDAYKVLKPSL